MWKMKVEVGFWFCFWMEAITADLWQYLLKISAELSLGNSLSVSTCPSVSALMLSFEYTAGRCIFPNHDSCPSMHLLKNRQGIFPAV